MTRLNRLPLIGLLALLVVTGCEQTSEPVRRNILGSWVGQGPAGLNVVMTLAETARSIEGAGGWNEGGTIRAFRASGALARDEVSLYFDFDDAADVSFQGVFMGDHEFNGELFGGTFSGQSITFVRERLEDR